MQCNCLKLAVLALMIFPGFLSSEAVTRKQGTFVASKMTQMKKALQHRPMPRQLSSGSMGSHQNENGQGRATTIPGNAIALPNLRPYQPEGWSDSIVVSKVEGSYTDSTGLSPSDSLYLSFAIINDGGASAGHFVIDFYFDTDKVSIPYDQNLEAGYYISGTDVPIGLLPAGSHTFKMVVDATGVVAESNEADNEYSKTIVVVGTNMPNLTPFQPEEWSDKIVVSNVKGTSSDVTPLTSSDALYVDFCGINDGTAPAEPFVYRVYLDGVLQIELETRDTLDPKWYFYIKDAPVGTLPAGTHILRFVLDADNVIVESDETDNEYTKTFTVVAADNETSTVFVPVLVSTPGLNGAFFTSEMIMTNKGSRDAILDFSYISSFGGGTGKGTDHLAAGHQLIVPDAISYLRSLGIPIPGSGNLGGTLTVGFSGLESSSDAAITVRTTAAAEGGRAGLSYPGVPLSSALNEAVYLCGLRQNASDRSNVAVQNAGLSDQGNVVLHLTVFSGDPNNRFSQALPDISLPPGGFNQISQILQSNGMNLTNGYVKVERISGSAPYYAYAVINDQANSDGSFVFPVRQSDFLGSSRLTLPVLVEANTFSSEIMVTNWSENTKTLHCEFISDAVQTQDKAADFTIELKPSEQLSIPDLIDYLRESSIPEIAPKGPAFAGALFVTVTEGDLNGIVVSARTSSPGGGGRYGLFYGALPDRMASDQSAWIYGLQQDAENRSNLAVVNIGETDNSSDTLSVEIFDGNTGAKVNTIEGISLNALGWKQFGAILATYTSGVTQGYARVTKTGGNNRFITYGVVNDGGQPGQRTGDGAFISSSP